MEKRGVPVRRERPHQGQCPPSEQPGAPSRRDFSERVLSRPASPRTEGGGDDHGSMHPGGARGERSGAGGGARRGPHRRGDPGVGTQAAEAPYGGRRQAGRPCRPELLLLRAWEPSPPAGEAGEGQLGPRKAHRWTRKRSKYRQRRQNEDETVCAPGQRAVRPTEPGGRAGVWSWGAARGPKSPGPGGPCLTPRSPECGSRGHTQGHPAQ